MPSQDKLIKNGIRYTDALFLEIINRLNQGVRQSDTLEAFIEKTKDYTVSNPLVVSGYVDKMLDIILQETNNHKFSRPAQKELTRVVIENHIGEKIVDVGDDIKNSVRDIVKEGYDNALPQDEIASNITKKVNGIKNKRARAIARTEIARTATVSDYVINKERGANAFTVDCRNTACDYCKQKVLTNPRREATGRGMTGDVVFSIDDTENLPPFHLNCRCVAMFFKKDSSERLESNLQTKKGRGNIIKQLKSKLESSNVKTYFKSDNTTIEEINTKKIKEELDIFREFTKDSPIEKGEFWDIHGNSVSRVFYGTEKKIEIPINETFNALKKGAKIFIHSHPNRYNSSHSIADIQFQIAANIKYSIVESYSQRFIIKYDEKSTNISREKLLLELEDFEKKFKSKLTKLTDEEMAKYDTTSMSDDEYSKLREKIWSEKYRDNHHEYQRELSGFFNSDTGLKLYVYDVPKRE